MKNLTFHLFLIAIFLGLFSSLYSQKRSEKRGVSYDIPYVEDLPVLSKGNAMNVSCTITNTGKLDGQEVAQFYIRDVVGSLARPIRELRGFRKINLKAGESKTVNFTLNDDQLAFWNADLVKRSEPGEFQVWISPDSQRGIPASFILR